MPATYAQLRTSHRSMLDIMRRSVGNDAYREYWENLAPDFTRQDPKPAPDFDDGRDRYVSWRQEAPEHTLQEVADAFGVSRERIRQIEAKALRKLRHPAHGANRLKAVAWGDDVRKSSAHYQQMHCGRPISLTENSLCYCGNCGMPILPVTSP